MAELYQVRARIASDLVAAATGDAHLRLRGRLASGVTLWTSPGPAPQPPHDPAEAPRNVPLMSAARKAAARVGEARPTRHAAALV